MPRTSPAVYAGRLFNVDAGDATLILEVRDSANGTLLARVVDRGTARELSSRINPAFAVTNQFWFDAMFRQWTSGVDRRVRRDACRTLTGCDRRIAQVSDRVRRDV